MVKRILMSTLAAGAVLLVSGTALPGGLCSDSAELVSFDNSTGELWAVPNGQSLTAYLNRHSTAYLTADLGTYEPPDPCLPPAQAWNFVVAYDQANHTRSRFVFELLMGTMSAMSCRATVTSVSNGSSHPLIAIRPTK